MRKSILVILLVAATVFAIGVPNGSAGSVPTLSAGTVAVLEKFITLPTPLCINTRANFDVLGAPDGNPISVYPFQDSFSITAKIPLSDFYGLAGIQTVATDAGIPVLLPFNPVKEFSANTTITVSVERDPFGAGNVYTPVWARPEDKTQSFTVSMGRIKAATVRNMFNFSNHFYKVKSRKEILDNFNVSWDNTALYITLTGLRYHNFGLVYDAIIAATGTTANRPPDNVLIYPEGPFRDIMRTAFDMDSNRLVPIPATGVADIVDFLQNVRIRVVTKYSHTLYGGVTRTSDFSTSTLDDNLLLGATDLLLWGKVTAPGTTVAGCDGTVFPVETERIKGGAPLVPTTLLAAPVNAGAE